MPGGGRVRVKGQGYGLGLMVGGGAIARAISALTFRAGIYGVTPSRTKADNEALLESRVLYGQMGPPAILGGVPLLHLSSMKKTMGGIDFGLHVLKALMAQLSDLIEAALPPAKRLAFAQAIRVLHNGGAQARSCFHRRKEAFDMKRILKAPLPDGSNLYDELGELAEAADAYARLIAWGLRVPYNTWKTNRAKTILMAGGLVAKFCIALKRTVPETVQTKEGEKPRQIYGSIFWHNLSTHLVEQLELMCTSHTMTEWVEMLWAPLRRLILRTTDRKVQHLVRVRVRVGVRVWVSKWGGASRLG